MVEVLVLAGSDEEFRGELNVEEVDVDWWLLVETEEIEGLCWRFMLWYSRFEVMYAVVGTIAWDWARVNGGARYWSVPIE